MTEDTPLPRREQPAWTQGPASARSASLALSLSLGGVVLAFSQMFIMCFPAPKLLAESAPLSFAIAIAVAGGTFRAGVPPFAVPLVAVVAFNTLSLARGMNGETFSLFFLPVASAATAAWLGSVLGSFPSEKRRLLLAVMVVHLACSLYGIIQYCGLDPFTWSVDYGRGRVFSSIGNPNFLAGQLVLVLPLMGALALWGRGSTAWLASLAFVAGFAVMILAQTRGAWIGLAFGIAILILLRPAGVNLRELGRRALVPGLAVAALLATFSVPALNRTGISLPAQFLSSFDLTQNSARQRFFWWRGAAELFLSRPLAGVGMGNFAPLFPKAATRVQDSYLDLPPAFCDHPHNDYLYVACEAGVLGLGLLAWLAYSCFRAIARAPGRQSPFTAGVLAGSAGLAVHAIWNMPSTIQPTLFTAGLLTGLAAPPSPSHGRDEARTSSGRPRRLYAGIVVLLAGISLAYRPVVILVAQSYLNGARIMKEHARFPLAAFLARQSMALSSAPWRQHFLLGSIFYAQGEGYYGQSLEEFREDEKENPWGADAVLHQGKAFRQMGRYEESERQCLRALELAPNYAEAAVTLASLEYFRARDAGEARDVAGCGRHLARARDWLACALRFFPRHAESLKLLGFVEIADERWLKAQDAWTRYVKEQPEDDVMRQRLLNLEANLPLFLKGGRPPGYEPFGRREMRPRAGSGE